jgi:hypothetical protein
MIAELDDDQAEFREKAFTGLKRLAPAVVNLLSKAKPRLPEAKARIEFLRDPKRADEMPRQERLHLARALEALELSANPLARRILEAQAVPEREDWVAQEARAALKRLAR